MCASRLCILVLINILLFNTAQGGRQCDRCVPVEECPQVGAMSRVDQAHFIEQFSCQKTQDDDLTFLFGFAPIARGDYVCCSESHHNQHLQRPQFPSGNQQTQFSNGNQSPQFSSGFQQPQLSNGNQRPQFANANFPGSQQGPGGFILNGNQNFNTDNGRIDPSIMSSGGQCQALTSYPPDPSSGCCGREASDADRIIGNPGYNPASSTITRRPSRYIKAPSAPISQAHKPAFSPFIPTWQNNARPSSPDMHRPAFAPRRFIRSTETKYNITLNNRITGGSATDIEQFPWTVLLKTTFNYGSRRTAAFSCGGSLISSRYVLTAGHCVHEDGAFVSDVEINLAEYDKRTFPTDCVSDHGQRKCIENIVMHAEDVIPHPAYDDRFLHNDIALIRLQGRAPYTEFIRPLCLPPIDVDSTSLKNLPLAVAGWGRDGSHPSNIKQYTVVNLVPQRDCMRHYSQLTRRQLCAAGYSGEDTCKGDSGGPLMMFYEGKYFVSGIVSGKRSDSPCGTSVPSLYTNVYHYIDWILNTIRN